MSVCVSVCLGVCLSVCLSVYTITQSQWFNPLQHIVVYENSSDDFEIFLHLPQYKLSVPISQLWQYVRKL